MNEQNVPHEPIQGSSNIWVTIVAVAITAIIVGGGVYALQKSSLQETAQSENWKTYIYKNLSLKYPENWIVVFDSEVAGQPNGFSLHIQREGDDGFQPDQLGLSTSNDRSGALDDYILNNDRVFFQRQSGDSYIKFITNSTTIYAGCGYYSKGEVTQEICNKIIQTVAVE